MEILSILLENDVDVNLSNLVEISLLYIVCVKGYSDIVNLFI